MKTKLTVDQLMSLIEKEPENITLPKESVRSVLRLIKILRFADFHPGIGLLATAASGVIRRVLVCEQIQMEERLEVAEGILELFERAFDSLERDAMQVKPREMN